MAKTLILKIGIFITLMGLLYGLLLFRLSKGTVDELYYKVTQEADGLIVGLSRADRGISPAVLTQDIQHENIVNFASYQSFFGEVYLEAIKAKITNSKVTGVYIVSVSPGGFVAPEGISDDQIKKLDERTIFGKLSNFTKAPNYNYLTSCYAYPLYSSLTNANRWENLTSHKDGWNEVQRVSATKAITASDIRHWTELSLRFSNQRIKKDAFSDYRHKYLLETITFLKKKGDVYLVRLPVANEIMQLENEHWHDFDKWMERIAIDQNIPYLSYKNLSDEYHTYDGSHMFSESAIQFTKVLANDIRDQNQHK